MTSRDIVHASVDSIDDPEEELSDKEAHHDPETDIHSAHLIVSFCQLLRDRRNVIGLQLIHAFVHNAQIVEHPQISLGFVGSLTGHRSQPGAPDKEASSPWIVQHQTHNPGFVRHRFIHDKTVDDNANGDPCTIADDNAESEFMEPLCVDLRGNRWSRHSLEPIFSCLDIELALQTPVDGGSAP